ncbi:hypothetical protein BDA99DRAFT_533482 [Phascolomyces articulosus]|uniref:Uncharacterized protein n=1 Tax=Phascolomyces articulosus TaxID=60185 RepID=A0AAD5KNW7_9FUNG|nr:hypothetical protein BDA99DRAFT_533482 [Phascolomyces articulosus]
MSMMHEARNATNHTLDTNETQNLAPVQEHFNTGDDYEYNDYDDPVSDIEEHWFEGNDQTVTSQNQQSSLKNIDNRSNATNNDNNNDDACSSRSSSTASHDIPIEVDIPAYEQADFIQRKSVDFYATAKDLGLDLPIEGEDGLMSLSKIHKYTIEEIEKTHKGLKEELIGFCRRHRVGCTELEDMVYAGSESIVQGHVFSTKPRQGASDNKKFAKITLPFDARAKKGENHTQNGRQRLLILANIELDTSPTSTNIPAGSHSRKRLYVTASYLDCAAMELQSLMNRNKYYYIYPTMFKHKYLDGSKL